MSNVTQTGVYLHIVNPFTGEHVYAIGYLISEDDDIVTIAQAISSEIGPYQQFRIHKANIKQRHDLPVTWW